MHADFEAANTTIYGASFDPIEANRRFAENNEFPYALLCDTTRAMGTAWGAAAPGSTGNAARIGVILDEQGVVLWAGQASASAFPKQALDIVTG